MRYLKCPVCGVGNFIWLSSEDNGVDNELYGGVKSTFISDCKCEVKGEVFHPYNKEVTKWIKYYIETESR